MSEHSNSKKEDTTSSSANNKNSKIFKPEEIEIINTSFSYSIPTSSMYYNSDNDIDITDNTGKTNSDILIDENKDISDEFISKEQNESPKFHFSENKPNKSSITTSLQNNINDNSINNSDASPITKTSNKRQSNSFDNKPELDNSSVIVEIDQEEENISIDNSLSLQNNNINSSFIIADKNINEANSDPDLKKKMELAENRISLATSGGITYVNNEQDLPMPANSDIVNKNLKNITDDALVHDSSVKEKEDTNEIDKESGDIANHEHTITFADEDEDNTCAICLIETQKPTDIDNLKDGSNETVVAPTKEEIDNYECKLHCMHKFHYSCIAQWLERSQNCPICRVDIKHYEIEAIEKRFDISIKIKDDNRVQLIQPRYNTTFDFNDIDLSEELVRDYLAEHFPHVNAKAYIYIKYFFFLIGYILLTIFGIVLSIISLLKGHEKLYFPHYVIVIILIIGSILHTSLLYSNIKKNNMINYMIGQPTSSPIFYGLVTIIFIILFNGLAYFVETRDKPYSLEKIFIYFIVLYFSIMMFWSCVEAIYCLKMFKEVDHRRVDAEVNRRNQEILERSRLEEAEEREYFEQHYSHLND